MILNILKGSLQPKLKGANVWPFNARSKVARGWVYHIWSLYRYCKDKIDQTQLQWYIRQFLRARAGAVFRLDRYFGTKKAVLEKEDSLSVSYPYPWENDIRIYLYPQKFTDIRKYLSADPYPRTSALNELGILVLQATRYVTHHIRCFAYSCKSSPICSRWLRNVS